MTSIYHALITLLIVSAVCVTAFAKPKRHGRAHTHGEAKLDIVVQDRTASVTFTIDTHSLLGFEHQAKTEKEKKAVANTYKVFRNNIHSIFAFENRLRCKFTEKKLKIESESKDDHHTMEDDHHEGHQSLQGDFDVTCDSRITPSRLTVSLAREFKTVTKIKVQVLAEKGAKSFEIPGIAAFNLE